MLVDLKLLNELSSSNFEVFSAGSHPSQVHPMSIAVMEEIGINISKHTSDHVDEYLNNGINIVITVCDRAANEICPIWQGNPLMIHWGVADPDRPDLSLIKQKSLFKSIYQELEQKFTQFIELDITEMDEVQLQ